MTSREELEKALEEIRHITGVHMQITAESPEELENALLQLRQLTGAYKERYNKNYFLQGLMLGNISTTEMESHAGKLHINTRENRLLFLIRTKTQIDDVIVELLKNLFPAQNKNYIVKMDNYHIVLLKPCKPEKAAEESVRIANIIVDTINAEAMSSVRVSFGTMIQGLAEVHESYQEALLAMQIGTIFYSGQLVISYQKLGIGRLIYQLPTALCENFLQEVFGEEIPANLDEELQATVHKFMQNNLNIAETSRQLHMHRNTLIYRLEQIEKHTGLDIRTFEDALTFKIAMMVMNYLESK